MARRRKGNHADDVPNADVKKCPIPVSPSTLDALKSRIIRRLTKTVEDEEQIWFQLREVAYERKLNSSMRWKKGV